jgi:hypothetical protein
VAYTETDLTSIRTARLRGIRTVQYADRSVTYSSDAEMRQVEQDILRELATVSPTRRKQFYGVASKGF